MINQIRISFNNFIDLIICYFRESLLDEQKTSGTQLLKQHSSPHVEYKCSYCNFVANTRFEVQRHSNETHELNVNDFATMELPPKTPKNMYKCFKCPKEFKKRQPYILHLTVHFRIKPYKVSLVSKQIHMNCIIFTILFLIIISPRV